MSNKSSNYEKVKNAMLAIQRYPWEQGVCAQAMFEAGETSTYVAMAHDAVLRQTPDGRLASSIGDCIAVTDPASAGEAVWRAYEHTGDDLYKQAALKMLEYLMNKAPRTSSGLICHNDISFHEGYSAFQIWSDSCYMLPPFLAVMEETEQACIQMDGYLEVLTDPDTGLLFHIYDTGTKSFVRKALWASGNGWALMGLARMIRLLSKTDLQKRVQYIKKGTDLLESMLVYRCESGMFRDILDDPNSFEDGTSAMMTAVFIYKGIADGWLNNQYLQHAELVYHNIQSQIDPYGIIRGVCGCPHFQSSGTSAEAQAVYIMMEVCRGYL